MRDVEHALRAKSVDARRAQERELAQTIARAARRGRERKVEPSIGVDIAERVQDPTAREVRGAKALEERGLGERGRNERGERDTGKNVHGAWAAWGVFHATTPFRTRTLELRA